MNQPNRGQHLTYQPSGNFSIFSLVIFAILSISVIPLLGIAYSYLVWYIPIVYFNFFATAGFGAVLGLLVYPIIRWGHVRAPKMEYLFMALVFLAGIYSSWAAHMTLVYNISGEGSLFAHTSFNWTDFMITLGHPGDLLHNITELSRHGLWSIGSLPITDFALWFVWVLEGFIIAIVIWKVNSRWSLLPYSELDQSWRKKVLLAKKITLHRGILKFIDALSSGKLAPLLEAPLTSIHNMEYTELAIFTSLQDQTAYLAFFNKTLGRDNKGNKKVEHSRIGDFYIISKQQKEDLINHFEIAEKQAINL